MSEPTQGSLPPAPSATPPRPATPSRPPLCVDLDGTLVGADTLHLSLALLARRKPWLVSVLPFVVWQGRAAFKRYISDRVALDAAALPYREDIVEFLRAERRSPRSIFLATAADARIATAVADHLGLFDGVIASDGRTNAKGVGKVEAIRNYLGGAEFDYMGDSLVDLPVFRAARLSYLVRPAPRLVVAAGTGCRIERIFKP